MSIPYILLQTIVVPLIATGLVYLLHARLGRRVGWLAFVALLYASALLVLVGSGIYGGGSRVEEYYPWAPSVGVTFGVFADNLSLPGGRGLHTGCTATAVCS